jgi:hypothetical protein
MGVTRFKALSVLRQRGRAAPQTSSDNFAERSLYEMTWEGMDDPSDNHEDELLKKETRTQIRSHMSQLSGKHREIIDLLLLSGETPRRDCRNHRCFKTRAFFARRQRTPLMTASKSAPRRAISKAA